MPTPRRGEVRWPEGGGKQEAGRALWQQPWRSERKERAGERKDPRGGRVEGRAGTGPRRRPGAALCKAVNRFLALDAPHSQEPTKGGKEAVGRAEMRGFLSSALRARQRSASGFGERREEKIHATGLQKENRTGTEHVGRKSRDDNLRGEFWGHRLAKIGGTGPRQLRCSPRTPSRPCSGPPSAQPALRGSVSALASSGGAFPFFFSRLGGRVPRGVRGPRLFPRYPPRVPAPPPPRRRSRVGARSAVLSAPSHCLGARSPCPVELRPRVLDQRARGGRKGGIARGRWAFLAKPPRAPGAPLARARKRAEVEVDMPYSLLITRCGASRP